MPTDKLPDDIAALLRDARATDAPKTKGRVHAPGVAITATLAGFVAGILCGIAGTYLVAPLLAAPAEIHVPVAFPAVQPAQTLAAVAPAPVAPPPRVVVVKSKPVPVATVIPALPAHGFHMTERAAERAWLDAARTALSQDDFDGASSNLEIAGARFPDGPLREEREALAIHVLLARGDRQLADLAIDTFRARHPGSPFVLAIEEAMQEMEVTR